MLLDIVISLVLGYAYSTADKGRPSELGETKMAESKPKFTFHPYTPADKPGHYDEEVQDLIEQGPGIAITIQVPVKKDQDSDKEIAKHKRWFQESAKRFDRSARLVDVSDQEDGSIHLDFILGDLIKRTRKPKAVEAEAETPAEDAAA